MKVTIAILVVLGLAAAVSAMLLVGSLRAGKNPEAEAVESQVVVVIAAKSLPAMTVLTADHVAEKEVPKDNLPQGYFTSSIQMIGKILAVPVTEEQVLTRSCLVHEGSGAMLAAAIPHGMRAVSVSLSKNAIAGGLLYPGCVVDVLVSFSLRSSANSRGQALSTTLLNGIQVLAVGTTTVVSNGGAEESKAKVEKSRSGSNVTVTLLVDPRQAEALQLSTTYGKLSLAMRNPLDKQLVDVDATVLSQGKMAQLGSLLTPVVLSNKQKIALLNASRAAKDDAAKGAESAEKARVESQIEALFKVGYEAEEEVQHVSPSRWSVTVIRGREVKNEELDISRDEVFLVGDPK